MHRKRVLYIQEGMQTELDADFELCSAAAANSSLPPTDLVVCSLTDMRSDGIAALEQKLRLADNVGLLLMVEADALKLLRLPAHIRADFALSNAPDDELLSRLIRFLSMAIPSTLPISSTRCLRFW